MLTLNIGPLTLAMPHVILLGSLAAGQSGRLAGRPAQRS